MKATELTVQLPREEADFLEAYAREHATSVAELFARYVRRLQNAKRPAPHPANLKFTAAVPPETDAREDHRQHIIHKHR